MRAKRIPRIFSAGAIAATALALAGSLAGCVAQPTRVVVRPAPVTVAEVVVRRPPPPLRYIPPPPPPPRRAELWAWEPAHWHWDGRDYRWVKGRYIQRPVREAEWVPAEWLARDGVWVYRPGHWRYR
jgi:hypothetical protein